MVKQAVGIDRFRINNKYTAMLHIDLGFANSLHSHVQALLTDPYVRNRRCQINIDQPNSAISNRCLRARNIQ
jgi:hypothetical protein